ncbi:MAG: beta-N-acetylhexosaminidase [Proteobacteria bacterium]|nr:beta-N-acetylhexosaminidase [Pseudomonadota bacterium]MBU4011062.1 beta-N-acetylhexosaminidase [Pseudomonadota bacterium]MBU4037568.1 beta-N-acetylhexosaminidase [Pseudomonadota bacterium]
MNISEFSMEQIAGQRLMVGFDGTTLARELMFLIDTVKVGGLILFSANIETPEQIKNLCDSAQAYARSCNQPPLIISIDQEGGQVVRLKEPLFTRFSGNPEMKSEKDAVIFAQTTANELLEVGINMDMAPVVDVAPEGIKSIMAGRAFGCDPYWVSKMGVTVIENMQAKKIMAVAKHFPGIGRTVPDSHIELPILDTKLNDLESFDLIPFYAAIRHNVSAIMLSHILYTKIDEKWPASLSEKIARELLRDHMGYEGIVMTDDLDMGAINNIDIKTVIKQILYAGIDMALICHAGPNIEYSFEEILKNMRDSKAIEREAEKSVRRILMCKGKYL